jgi:hypothetical protein
MIEIIEKIIQELEKMDPRYYDSVLNFVRDSIANRSKGYAA